MRAVRSAVASVLALFLICTMVCAIAEEPSTSPEPTASPVPADYVYPPLPVDHSPGPPVNKENYSQDGLSYNDPTIQVQIHEDRAFETPILYAHIRISDPTQLRTAASGSFNSQATQLGANIARRYNAVVAINGDYFVYDSRSYAVRQGVQYRNRPTGEDVLIIDDQGDFHALFAPEKAQDIVAYVEEMEAGGRSVINAFTFGPILVHNGKMQEVSGKRYFNVSPGINAQRVALAQLGPLEYLIISTQGPEDKNSKGLTIPEMAAFVEEVGYRFSDKGCLTAYNLDGGSTNTLYFNGGKINSPGGKSRHIADIIYFATLVR